MAEQYDHSETPGHPSHAPAQNRFFSWMRSLGIVRGNGWIGGVCGGIAGRLGIDPLIVRGIIVVVAVLGGPAFLFYAAAWLLLPDAHDEIHLERLIKGHLEPAVIAIAVIALLSFLPVTQGIWWAGAQFWSEPFWPASVGRTLWSLIVVGLIVAVVIWAARSSRVGWRGGDSGRQTAAAPTVYSQAAPSQAAPSQAAPSQAAPSQAAPASSATAYATAAPTTREPAAPADPPPAATEQDLDAWKASQTQWKAEHDAWRQARDAEERAVRQQRSVEIREQSRAMTAQAEEARRRRRLANPRTGGAFIGITFGVALLAGAIATALASADPAITGYAVAIGFAAATLVFGLAIMLAGLLRRRSGFLSFVSILLVATTVLLALPPRGRDLIVGSGYDQAIASKQVFVPLGSYSLQLDTRSGSAATGSTLSPRVVDVQQGIGAVDVSISRGLTVQVIATQQTNGPSFTAQTLTDTVTTSQNPTVVRLPDGQVRSSIRIGKAATPDVIVRITQWIGAVSVTDVATAGQTTGDSPAPDATTAPSTTVPSTTPPGAPSAGPTTIPAP